MFLTPKKYKNFDKKLVIKNVSMCERIELKDDLGIVLKGPGA